MNKADMAKIMSVLQVAYPRFYAGESAERLRQATTLWAEMFEPYDSSVVAYAVKAYIADDTSGFPPTIGQIMEKVRLLTDKPQMGESEAWILVKKAICNGAYHAQEEFGRLPPAVRRVVKDPGQLRQWAISSDFNDAVESSNFKRAYRTACEQERKYMALPPDVRKLASGLAEALGIDEREEDEKKRITDFDG